jgi:hypothetical protein
LGYSTEKVQQVTKETEAKMDAREQTQPSPDLLSQKTAALAKIAEGIAEYERLAGHDVTVIRHDKGILVMEFERDRAGR